MIPLIPEVAVEVEVLVEVEAGVEAEAEAAIDTSGCDATVIVKRVTIVDDHDPGHGAEADTVATPLPILDPEVLHVDGHGPRPEKNRTLHDRLQHHLDHSLQRILAILQLPLLLLLLLQALSQEHISLPPITVNHSIITSSNTRLYHPVWFR